MKKVSRLSRGDLHRHREMRSRLSRLPLRTRLVAGFSAAMFFVLVAAGGFVYWRVSYALDEALDSDLAQASATIGPLVDASGTVSNHTTADATGADWQVLDASGRVVDRGGLAAPTAMVSTHRLSQLGNAAVTFNVGDFLPVSERPYRLRITRVDGNLHLLVGVRRDHRDEALRELLGQLLLAGIGALLLTALVGDRLARAALRPVERYRSQAAEIASGAVDFRLDVPPGRDDEVTRLGHTLNEMLSTLERALDRERQFVNEASHELRTPITLLTSRVQLAQRRPRTQGEHERILDELRVDLDHLAGLAGQLLDLGGLSERVRPGAADLAAAAARVIDRRRLAFPERASDISASLAAEPVPAALADFELERLVTNLLDNAVVHGSPPFEVSVDTPASGWARLVVTDAGGGMPGAFLETATRRFARADDARSQPGTGLGLALVQALVSGANGELRLCHDGHHASHGVPTSVPCSHSAAMTVTVLLPAHVAD